MQWLTMARRSAAALAIAALIGVAGGPARAGELYFDFSFSGQGVAGSGTLATSDVPDPAAPFADAYDILSIEGSVNGDAITGLLGSVGPAEYSADGYFIYDNDFYPAGSASPAGGFFDDDGLLFTTADSNYNLFFDGSAYWDWQDQGSGIAVAFNAVDPPPPAAPEPSSLLLLLGMIAGCAALRTASRTAPTARRSCCR